MFYMKGCLAKTKTSFPIQFLLSLIFILFQNTICSKRPTVQLFVAKFGIDAENPLSEEALHYNAT